jgi:hypothetical protein
VDELEEKVLEAATVAWKSLKGDFSGRGLTDPQLDQLNKHRGATTDEILHFAYSGDSYVGRFGLHERVRYILEAHGYVKRRWSLDRRLPKDTKLRWRHKNWPMPERGNPDFSDDQ